METVPLQGSYSSESDQEDRPVHRRSSSAGGVPSDSKSLLEQEAPLEETRHSSFSSAGRVSKLPTKKREKIESIFEKLLDDNESVPITLTKQNTIRPQPRNKLSSFLSRIAGKSSGEQTATVTTSQPVAPPIDPALLEEQEKQIQKRKEQVAAILERLSSSEIDQERVKKKKYKKKGRRSSIPKDLPRQETLDRDDPRVQEASFSDTDSLLSYHVAVHPGRVTPLKASAAAAARALFPIADDRTVGEMANPPPRRLNVPETESDPESPGAQRKFVPFRKKDDPNSDSDFDWTKPTPLASPSVIAGMSEYELKALQAFTAPEGGLLGEHSAETLREMAKFHKQETLKDSEILNSLVEFAEEEEKQKHKSSPKINTEEDLYSGGEIEEKIPEKQVEEIPEAVKEQENKPDQPVETEPAKAPAPQKSQVSIRPGSSIAKAAMEFLAKREAQISSTEPSPQKPQRPNPPIQERPSPIKEEEAKDIAEDSPFLQNQMGKPPVPPKSESESKNEQKMREISSFVPQKMTISRVERARSTGGSYDLENTPLFGKNGLEPQNSVKTGTNSSTYWKELAGKVPSIVGDKLSKAGKWAVEVKDNLVSRYNAVPQDVLEEPPKKKVWLPGDSGDDPKKRKFSIVDWICDWRLIILLGVLFLILTAILAAMMHAPSKKSIEATVDVKSFSPPPPPADFPVCAGPCCSNKAPVIPAHTPAMPSYWWSNLLTDRAKIQIRCTSNEKYLGPQEGSDSWREVGGFRSSLEASEYFVVMRVSGNEVRLRSPEGYYLAAKEDGSVLADQSGFGPETVFVVEKVSDSSSQVTLFASDGKALVVLPDGSLARTHNTKFAEIFEVKEIMLLPSPRGVILGGWLVAEEWMDPSLFVTIPAFTDGLFIQLQSVFYGKWLTVLPTGSLNCSVEDPGDWDTFRVRDIDSQGFQFRTQEYLYLGVREEENFRLFGDSLNPGVNGTENFQLIFNPVDPTEFMMKASNGKFLVVHENGTLSASVAPEELDLSPGHPDWNGPTVFGYNETEALRGEWQLTHNLNVNTAPLLEHHRKTWIIEEDFRWLADQNINALRIPVGYWIAEGGQSEYPYAAEGVTYLDSAFTWAEKYGLRIYLSLHGAAGSQNGLEHSGSRDGVPSFSTNETNINRTLDAIEWFAERYSNSSAFHGIGLLNEPAAEVHLKILLKYYSDAYERVRKHSSCAFVGLQPRIGGDPYELDGFLGTDGHNNVMLERHFFNIFNPIFSGVPAQEHIRLVTENRSAEIEDLQDNGHLLTVGGWSLGLPENVDPTTQDLMDFADAQLDTYGQATAGWYFMSYKVTQYNWSSWDFRDSVMNGWLRQKEGGGW